MDDLTCYRKEYNSKSIFFSVTFEIRTSIRAFSARRVSSGITERSLVDGASACRCVCVDAAMRASCKPDTGPAQTDAPFVGDTTHRCDFTRKPTAPPLIHNPDPYVAPAGPMSSDTTNRCDFDRKPLNKVPAWRPKDRRRPAGQFEVGVAARFSCSLAI